MRIATFTSEGHRKVGLVSADGKTVTPLQLTPEQADSGVLTLIEILARGGSLPEASGPAVDLREVVLDAPLPKPRRNLWCVGRNYHAHAKELSASVFKDNAAKTDEWPIVFTKVPECVVGPHDEVLVPAGVSAQIDYEAELAVVIGKGGKNIARDAAMSHVFGYTVVNDVTARDVQMRHGQWDLGKSFDTFCPMGPWIVTADEFDGTKTRVRCWVNGELRQDGPTENMIFDIPTLIETISRGITLYPGDVIATGTPAGVGMGMNPPRYLRAGDVVRVEIDGLGAIENKFV
ncbi:2-keto-4-pentenoate hydratase/2-oxohepta-3-ene-1,7-dioic acid hydratase in catechol pathway [Variovorax boronicumulans]|uniref:2-keto-4-pentenoate hydratase/2-oxohepta-3-ene-1,7-dioic acid hydratase in catechol pathway n=1 Tax=Variovorax boronicumulans TaxID=436515 RepID=A0AAW8CJP1_9BURK|nr:fumarylacetoacetate hydrolase family protein [Variovorax boronicumulans]MDP9891538.1 2-keto-4-pentenoate hydratase/2-oxohepta-3-ene-1,7-dioic acid hydratase in catechol pathway [Variovorax boronicumulans]MDQ0051606.1 2-keto-4-pentenoate hydratase/2-oxohepta-3-ene-1,7-dioic acid hydratase in catechol pathway [Variovorax boronicumulans]